MDAVTYPDETTSDFISNNVVPLRIAADHKPLSADFNVTWTPALFILDENGKEHQRTVGFLGTDELIPSILLGTGNAHFDNNQFTSALECYETIIKQYPESDSAQEAIFQSGVASYKNTQNPTPLRDAYEKLKAEYPDGQWVKRAYPYRLIG